ncbi:MAG: flagellin lysine-N-methylase [Oscillospiraceae bacterium]|nr:flagellin lysine-N-methylase [Oscillospiraceae bacterium]
MILKMPDYYRKFTCTADKCSDNCCIGWEIDIDDNTADYYNSVKVGFGTKLRNNISDTVPKSFILGENERCPFLNDRNLCEIILTLGEDKLCSICTEHPRYYEWFGSIKEGGIGLCCEEASRIIISADNSSNTYETEIPNEGNDFEKTPLYTCLLEVREEILAYLTRDSLPLSVKIRDIIDYAEDVQSNIDNSIYDIPQIISSSEHAEHCFTDVLALMSALEPIDGNWLPYLEGIMRMYDTACNKRGQFLQNNPEVEQYLCNIAVYFIWRYFMKGTFDGEILSRVKLMAVSVAVIGYMYLCKWLESGTLTHEDCAQLAKNYSKEIEYSEENLEAMLDAAYELAAFEDNALKGLFA